MFVDPQKSNPLRLDRAQLSAATRSRVDGTGEADRVPEGTVSPERMREVLRRLDQDYYSGAEIQDKVGHAVLQARDLVGSEPFAVMLGDDIVDAAEPCIGQMMRVYERRGNPVIALQEVPHEDISSYGCAEPEWVEGDLATWTPARPRAPRRA